MKISRRKFIGGIAASAAYAALPKSAHAASGILAGAIRFDPWYVSTGSYTDIATIQGIQNMLSPPRWQSLSPWFCSKPNSFKVTCDAVQANMDTEIICAVNGGFKHFMFQQQASTSALGVAKTLFDSSPNKSLIKWSWVGGLSGLGSTGNFATQVAGYVSNFQQSNYMQVLTNRPLFFIFWRDSFFQSNWGGSYSNVAAAITALRTASTNAGLGSPYIVIIDSSPSAAVAEAVGIGADAISFYNQSFYGSFSGLSTATQAAWTAWNSAASTASLGYVPTTVTGWDVRPQRESPSALAGNPWAANNAPTPYVGMSNAATPGTTTQITTLAQACVTFTLANPTTCASKAMNVCAWDECVEEGSPLIPSFGDPPVSNTNNILTALNPIIN